MSQILDDCTAIQASLLDAWTKCDQVAAKITSLESSGGATEEEKSAVRSALDNVVSLNTKITGLVSM